MKPLLLIVLAGIAGSGLGYGLTWSEFHPATQPIEWMNVQAPPSDENSTESAFAPGEGPVAHVIGGEVYNFGLMESNTEAQHEFVIANHGKATLRLTKGRSSCRCTIGTLADDQAQIDVAPGGEVPVMLEWHTKQKVGPFSTSVQIRTNDPNKEVIELSIQGDVLQTAIVQPAELVLTSLSTTLETTVEVKVCSVREEDFELGEFQFADPTTAPLFDVQLSRIPDGELGIPNTTHGWLVRVTVKPGLPLGPLKQRLLIKSTLQSLPEVDIPILGMVSGDITVAGRGWNAAMGAINMGLIQSEMGASRELQLHVRGGERHNTTITVEKVEPEFLQVQLGEKHELAQGSVVGFPLTITIPKGLQPCNHIGSEAAPAGEVILTTNHPDVKQVRIKVHFVVTR